MDEPDFDGMYSELLKGFINREYIILNPSLRLDLVEAEAIDLYQNDAMFNRRVQQITSQVLKVVQDYC